ncbi:MAG: Flp family type IVb pilin [Pseudomonadota bacterium]
MKTLNRFLRDESGATAIEYGLIAALISVAIITAVTNFGSANEAMYNEITTAVDGAI